MAFTGLVCQLAAFPTVWFSLYFLPLYQAVLMSLGLSVCLSLMEGWRVFKWMFGRCPFLSLLALCHGPACCLEAWKQVAGVWSVGPTGRFFLTQGNRWSYFLPHPPPGAPECGDWAWDHWGLIPSFSFSFHQLPSQEERNVSCTIGFAGST